MNQRFAIWHTKQTYTGIIFYINNPLCSYYIEYDIPGLSRQFNVNSLGNSFLSLWCWIRFMLKTAVHMTLVYIIAFCLFCIQINHNADSLPVAFSMQTTVDAFLVFHLRIKIVMKNISSAVFD